MRHEHLVVTVEAETKARIDDDLEPGESLEAWVADAIERKLADDEESSGEDFESDASESESDGETRTLPDFRDGSGRSSGEGRGRSSGDERGRSSDEERDGEEYDDEYDDGFEFVDDCSI